MPLQVTEERVSEARLSEEAVAAVRFLIKVEAPHPV
jgi:hypothetical protein